MVSVDSSCLVTLPFTIRPGHLEPQLNFIWMHSKATQWACYGDHRRAFFKILYSADLNDDAGRLFSTLTKFDFRRLAFGRWSYPMSATTVEVECLLRNVRNLKSCPRSSFADTRLNVAGFAAKTTSSLPSPKLAGKSPVGLHLSLLYNRTRNEEGTAGNNKRELHLCWTLRTSGFRQVGEAIT